MASKAPDEFFGGCVRMQRHLDRFGGDLVKALKAQEPLALHALVALLSMGEWADEVLEELVEDGFLEVLNGGNVVYPEIVEQVGDGKLKTPVWPTTGLLNHFGYNAKADGPPEHRRHEILQRFFGLSLHGLRFDRHYLAEWGEPRSCRRLQKIVYCIASFANNNLRKANPPYEAIRKWEADINWIKAGNLDQGRCTRTIQFPRIGQPR